MAKQPTEMSDEVFIPKLTKEQIELEHQLIVLDETAYSNFVVGFTEGTELDRDDFEVALSISGADEFFSNYYLAALFHEHEDQLTHTELNILNQLYRQQAIVQEALERIKRLEAVSESLGLEHSFERAMEVLDALVTNTLMEFTGDKLDS